MKELATEVVKHKDIRIMPHRFEKTYFNIGNCYFHEKKLVEAIEAYATVLSITKDHKEALYNKKKAEGLLKEEERKKRDNPLGDHSKEKDHKK